MPTKKHEEDRAGSGEVRKGKIGGGKTRDTHAQLLTKFKEEAKSAFFFCQGEEKGRRKSAQLKMLPQAQTSGERGDSRCRRAGVGTAAQKLRTLPGLLLHLESGRGGRFRTGGGSSWNP